ncbi:hypothetical protein A3J90_04255 [candidate division WOR-1 bacterium RIFOXYC2_FULL_37_10]|uniref:Uncharacterized protein n=1 Tax=candidate division WOR-1 bacterium RIFOXYB2_FULL_37_13 TaxID=1802579 RepID=A0A1F4SXZ3_UNCSA|nr:MAG: hypothetical protein A2310_08945 [candidate division WOR-1 bacterium RIFOXYB2_FULL_37_13]OGC34148.1 MAG: hypothetical protein A3J90_04255 [candidate division WOR-1 bacterium RIFOXYC2_FULL_37_10]
MELLKVQNCSVPNPKSLPTKPSNIINAAKGKDGQISDKKCEQANVTVDYLFRCNPFDKSPADDMECSNLQKNALPPYQNFYH